jgi:hypothetical protein
LEAVALLLPLVLIPYLAPLLLLAAVLVELMLAVMAATVDRGEGVARLVARMEPAGLAIPQALPLPKVATAALEAERLEFDPLLVVEAVLLLLVVAARLLLEMEVMEPPRQYLARL